MGTLGYRKISMSIFSDDEKDGLEYYYRFINKPYESTLSTISHSENVCIRKYGFKIVNLWFVNCKESWKDYMQERDIIIFILNPKKNKYKENFLLSFLNKVVNLKRLVIILHDVKEYDIENLEKNLNLYNIEEYVILKSTNFDVIDTAWRWIKNDINKAIC